MTARLESDFAAAVANDASAASLAPLVIDHRTHFSGVLVCTGDVRLTGSIEGEVRCRSLIVGERGAVEGLVVADSVVVAGEVQGEIYANRLVLKTACSVEGQIYHGELLLEDGSYFEGQSRRHAQPLKLAPAYK